MGGWDQNSRYGGEVGYGGGSSPATPPKDCRHCAQHVHTHRVSLKVDTEALRLAAEEALEQNKKWKEEMMEQQVCDSVWR